jgi:replication factor C subunit 2/4
MSTGTGSLELPWIEKYRPLVLKDIVGNEETVERMKIISQRGNMPNLLISGAPGIGKTTSILCLARELLGEKYQDATLELNASDDRGIDVVRQSIKMFAQKKVSLPAGRHKIVILDEADSMTIGAQQALRRTMELYAETTRFALACNFSSKIIEPIQSRCTILRFIPPSQEQILRRVLEICALEDISYTPDGLEALLFSSQSDMRQIINNLQSTVTGFGIVNAENIYKMVDMPQPARMKRVLEACANGALDPAIEIFQSLYQEGYAPLDMIGTLFRVAKTATFLSERLQLEVIRVSI